MLKFLLMILASSLLTQAVPVPTTTNCTDYPHKPVDIASHIGENGEISLDKNSKLKFPAKDLFPCGLPSEFTMCISYSSSGKNRKERCLFYLDNPATESGAALAVCFEPDNSKLRLEYQDQTLRFNAPEETFDLFEAHKISVAVTLNSVSITIDCNTTQNLSLTRSSTSPVSNEGTFHMGGITSPVFVGIIDHLEISPSSSEQKCCGDVKPESARPHCDNHTEGLLWLNNTSDVLYKCVGSEWTRTGDVDLTTSEDSQCSKKLSYLEHSQDLESSIKSSYIKQFVIEGIGSFLAVAIYQENSSIPTDSFIYRKFSSSWVFHQYIETHSAQAVQFLLAPPNTPLLVVANKAGTTSPVYKWDYGSSRFTLHQRIATHQARDIESFEISGESYLAVANHAKPVGLGLDYSINSVIYKWDGSEFVEYQQIPTKGAIDFEHFKVDQYNLLAVANVLDGLTTRVDSAIYYFNRNTQLFNLLQSIPTIGAADWEHFEINGDHYLVVANTVAYTKPTRAPTQISRIFNPSPNNVAVHSIIYKLDKAQVQFKPYQEIETFKASDWEAFKVGCSHYLIVSNSDTNQNGEITSVVYQYQGLEQFVPVHSIKLHGAASWELYSEGEDQYLACASNLSGETKVIKLIS